MYRRRASNPDLSASLRLTSVRVPAATDFSEMLKKEYVLGKASTGEPQYMHEASGTIMLISDLALLEEPSLKECMPEWARTSTRARLLTGTHSCCL